MPRERYGKLKQKMEAIPVIVANVGSFLALLDDRVDTSEGIITEGLPLCMSITLCYEEPYRYLCTLRFHTSKVIVIVDEGRSFQFESIEKAAEVVNKAAAKVAEDRDSKTDKPVKARDIKTY